MKRLADMLLGGRKTKKIEIQSTKDVIILQSLTAGEQAEIDAQASSSGLNAYAHLEASKIPTLARSIVSMNGQPLENFAEVRDILRNEMTLTPVMAIEKVLKDMDKENINLLFAYYFDLEKERQDEREKLKNDSRVPRAESFGNSAPSSAPTPEPSLVS
jgi:hypothetical protein